MRAVSRVALAPSLFMTKSIEIQCAPQSCKLHWTVKPPRSRCYRSGRGHTRKRSNNLLGSRSVLGSTLSPEYQVRLTKTRRIDPGGKSASIKAEAAWKRGTKMVVRPLEDWSRSYSFEHSGAVAKSTYARWGLQPEVAPPFHASHMTGKDVRRYR